MLDFNTIPYCTENEIFRKNPANANDDENLSEFTGPLNWSKHTHTQTHGILKH